MIVPFSQPQRIDRKRFRALFRTPTPLHAKAASHTSTFEKLFQVVILSVVHPDFTPALHF